MPSPSFSFTPFVTALQTAFEPALKRVTERHWMVEVSTGGGRSQIVHVQWAPHLSRSRIVLSSPIGTPTRSTSLEALLRLNATLEEGMLCLEDYRDAEGALVTHLVLRALVPALGFPEDALPDVVRSMARQADALEHTLFVTDSY